MTIQDFFIYVIVSCCIVYVARNFFKLLSKKKRKDAGCGYGCSGCSLAKKDENGLRKGCGRENAVINSNSKQ